MFRKRSLLILPTLLSIHTALAQEDVFSTAFDLIYNSLGETGINFFIAFGVVTVTLYLAAIKSPLIEEGNDAQRRAAGGLAGIVGIATAFYVATSGIDLFSLTPLFLVAAAILLILMLKGFFFPKPNEEPGSMKMKDIGIMLIVLGLPMGFILGTETRLYSLGWTAAIIGIILVLLNIIREMWPEPGKVPQPTVPEGMLSERDAQLLQEAREVESEVTAAGNDVFKLAEAIVGLCRKAIKLLESRPALVGLRPGAHDYRYIVTSLNEIFERLRTYVIKLKRGDIIVGEAELRAKKILRAVEAITREEAEVAKRLGETELIDAGTGDFRLEDRHISGSVPRTLVKRLPGPVLSEGAVAKKTLVSRIELYIRRKYAIEGEANKILTEIDTEFKVGTHNLSRLLSALQGGFSNLTPVRIMQNRKGIIKRIEAIEMAAINITKVSRHLATLEGELATLEGELGALDKKILADLRGLGHFA